MKKINFNNRKFIIIVILIGLFLLLTGYIIHNNLYFISEKSVKNIIYKKTKLKKDDIKFDDIKLNRVKNHKFCFLIIRDLLMSSIIYEEENKIWKKIATFLVAI